MKKNPETPTQKRGVSLNKLIFFGFMGTLVFMVIVFISFTLIEKTYQKNALETPPSSVEQTSDTQKEVLLSHQDTVPSLVQTIDKEPVKDASHKHVSIPQPLKADDTLFITLDKTLSAALKKETSPLLWSELGFPSTFRLVVDRSEHILKVYENDRFIKAFPIGVGRLGKETPEGQYRIITKLEKPYYRTKHIAGGDPNNPLGSHWLGLDVPGTDGSIYGLHGTNDPDSIGKNVSAGCVRLYNEDIQWLYEHLPLGTEIIIR